MAVLTPTAVTGLLPSYPCYVRKGRTGLNKTCKSRADPNRCREAPAFDRAFGGNATLVNHRVPPGSVRTSGESGHHRLQSFSAPAAGCEFSPSRSAGGQVHANGHVRHACLTGACSHGGHLMLWPALPIPSGIQMLRDVEAETDTYSPEGQRPHLANLRPSARLF